MLKSTAAYILESSQLPVYLLQLFSRLLHRLLDVFQLLQFSFLLRTVLFVDYCQYSITFTVTHQRHRVKVLPAFQSSWVCSLLLPHSWTDSPPLPSAIFLDENGNVRAGYIIWYSSSLGCERNLQSTFKDELLWGLWNSSSLSESIWQVFDSGALVIILAS